MSVQAAWLLKAATLIDLTTLAGDDTASNVHRLCLKALQPVRYDLLQKIDMHDKGPSSRLSEKLIKLNVSVIKYLLVNNELAYPVTMASLVLSINSQRLYK